MEDKKYKTYQELKEEPNAIAENKAEEKTTPVVFKQRTTKGVVCNCLSLNVRSKPDPEAEVAFVLSALTEVQVFPESSTNEFYKVYTSAGVDGYCMKEFIALKK